MDPDVGNSHANPPSCHFLQGVSVGAAKSKLGKWRLIIASFSFASLFHYRFILTLVSPLFISFVTGREIAAK